MPVSHAVGVVSHAGCRPHGALLRTMPMKILYWEQVDGLLQYTSGCFCNSDLCTHKQLINNVMLYICWRVQVYCVGMIYTFQYCCITETYRVLSYARFQSKSVLYWMYGSHLLNSRSMVTPTGYGSNRLKGYAYLICFLTDVIVAPTCCQVYGSHLHMFLTCYV